MGVLICGIDWKSKERQYTREVPVLEQMAHEVLEQISAPVCHDDIRGEGGSVLRQMYESSLGYWPKEPA